MATPKADETVSGTEVSAADLQAQIRALKEDLAELSASMGRFTRAQAEALRAGAMDGLQAMKESGQEQMAVAGEYAGRKYAETEDFIRANPATAVGIAAGIGFLIGLITSRR